jgi:predicted lipid carrier protein YhbT
MSLLARLAPPVPPAPLRRLIESLPVAPPSHALALALDRVLLPRLDAAARTALSGRCVEVHVRDYGVRARLTLKPEGFAAAAAGDPVAVRVNATGAALWCLAAGREDADTLFFERTLIMSGDTEFALRLKNTLDAIGPLMPEWLRGD